MKILAISYYAPPQLTPQAIQIGRQLYHLTDARIALLHGRDPQFSDGFDQYPDFFQRVESLDVPSLGAVPQGLRHRLARRVVPLYGAVPDGLGPWRRRARRVALAAIAAERPDALVSFGMPMTDHLLGLDLKRATGLPWLAHFSDPWAGNPHDPRSRLEHAANVRLERRVISSADRVLFTSDRTLEIVMSAYPPAWRARAAVLPHAWDLDHADPEPSQHLEPTSAPDSRSVVRHIGAFYGTRSPEPLFAALSLMLRHDPSALDEVRFELIGPVPAGFLESASYRSLPPGLVTVLPPVPYGVSLRVTRDSAALLVIDAPSAEPSVFLPSKLVESIGAGRPVWGISPPGTSADLITEWAGRDDACASPDDVEGVARMLAAGLDSLRNVDGGLDGSAPDHVRQRFAPDRVSAALGRFVQEAIGQRAPGS